MPENASHHRRIVELLWAPRRLASVAVGTTVNIAAIVGMTSVVLHLTMLMLYVVALSDQPFASVWHYLGEVARTVVAAVVLGGVFVYFVSIIGRTAYNYRTQLSLKVLLLSPVPMIVPVAVYALLLMVALAVVPERDWSPHPLTAAGQMAMAMLGSCWWTPVLFAAWLVIWQYAARQVEQLTPAGWPILCANCGHDLREAITGERTACPECDAPIGDTPQQAAY